MEKLKTLLPGRSADNKAEADANTSRPSGKLTGEATHFDGANMPGAWQDDANPTYEATKGTGISSNPSTIPTTDATPRSMSSEAARGTGISSAIADQASLPATGSRATPQSGHNPDALAAASSALGVTSTGLSTGSGATPASHPSSTSRATSTSTTTPPPGTSNYTASGSHATSTGTPIADTFTGARQSSGTEYVGGSAPGVAGQSVPREAPFSTSTSSGTGHDHASALTAGAVGATVGGLAGQSLAHQSHPAEDSSAAVGSSHNESSQPLSGTLNPAGPAGTGTPATISGFRSTTSHGDPSGSPSSGTKVSKPFASDPVSTEPIGGSSTTAIGSGGLASGGLASQSTSHYTGDSHDYSSRAGVSGAGLAGATGANNATSGARTGGPATGIGYGDQYNRLSDGTPSGIAVSDPAREGTATRTDGTSSKAVPAASNPSATSEHHYGRDAAGVAGLGAASGLAVHELGKDRSETTAPSQGAYNVSSSQAYLGSGGPQITTTGSSKPLEVSGTTAAYTKQAPQYATPAPLSSTAHAQSSTATPASSTGYGDQYNRLSDGTPSGIAPSDPAFPSSGTAGGTSQHGTASQHPSGRDAALGGAGAAAIAGTGAALASTSEAKPSATSSSGYGDQYNRLSDGTPSGIATSDPAHQAIGGTSDGSQRNQHHSGRDVALAGTAAAATGAGAAAYGSSTSHNATTGTSSTSTGYGDQYNHLKDGTPSGIATSDPAHQAVSGISGDPQRRPSGQNHSGRDAALASTAATATGAGAAAYVSSQSQSTPVGTSTSASGGYGDQYSHLKDGTPSGIAISDPAAQSILPAGTQSQRAASDQHHSGRDAAIGGAGVAGAGAGAAAYGLSEREKEVAGVPGTSNTANTGGHTLHEGSTKSSAFETEPHPSHQHESLDEPDSPTGTGETKKKRGFLSKILHRDDPNKLHKESKDSRKSLEAGGVEVPRTTHDAYGSNVDGGKTSHFGTDGEIGRGGQAISGYGHQDARQTLPLREAEKLEQSTGTGAGHTGHQ